MYKLIYNNLVIDVVKKPKYLRYLTKSGRTVLTNKTSAHCIMGSNNKDIYLLQGVNRPEGKDWKEVTVVAITENEYNSLIKLLASDQAIYADKNQLKHVQNEKISELNTICRNTIIEGVSVLFSDKKYHKFELTIEDQLNLMTIESEIKAGAKKILYHEKNKVCQMYLASDIQLLIDAVHKHKAYHTTYFNLLKNYIYSLHDIEKIREIEYGIELPDDDNIKLEELLN